MLGRPHWGFYRPDVRIFLTDTATTTLGYFARSIGGRAGTWNLRRTAGHAGARVSRARTLLVGGNDVFLDGIVEWVASDARLEVVGRAHSGAETLEQIDALHAELVLMDVTLPDMNGFEVTRRIAERTDAPLVILLSFHDSQVARLEAWAAGADGFVAKSEITACLTPLVGDLLGRRELGLGKQGSVIPFKRVPPTDLSK